ncbi:hypothetical protein J7E70_34095 [Variovorax paradoxus]|nr:hypothetical protein [Variovorax paradoxus]MBT2305428.1 hypothetical protein [Variovorax paradoxus]
MKHAMISSLISIGALCWSSDTWAFRIGPCLRLLILEDGELTQERLRWWNQCAFLPDQYKSAVHEHMSLASIMQYTSEVKVTPTLNGWEFNTMDEGEKSWPPNAKQPHYTRGIIFGTWWNDDPLMRTWGQGWDLITGSWDFGQSMKQKPEGEKYKAESGECEVEAREHLGRRSHFGTLQHLHFMYATDKKDDQSKAAFRVKTTTDAALKWMQFAYKVAIGEIKPGDTFDTKLEAESGLLFLDRNHCVQKKENLKIRTIFTLRDDDSKKYRDPLTPNVALGSMLHVIQDSFSPGHTCRIERQGTDGTYLIVADVENYNAQDHDSHGSLDAYPPWLTDLVVSKKRRYQNDPVNVGAWLIQAVDKPMDWGDVETHLRNTIFLAAPSDDQKLECIGGRAKRVKL